MNTIYDYPLQEQVDDYLKIDNLKIKEYLKNSQYIIPENLKELINGFIYHKKKYGSNVEKKFYTDCDFSKMLKRLITKRPLVFMGKGDLWILKSGDSSCGSWETIGTDSEKAPLLMKDYITYDEIELSSFISVSINTPFVNTGSRRNIYIKDSIHEPEGFYIGQCGARFEENSRMEFKYMLVTDIQNTEENGYGPKGDVVNARKLKHFAKFYSVEYFPEFEEAVKDYTGRFVLVNGHRNVYLDTLIYKRRIRYNAFVFLKDADVRAMNASKKAFVYAVGLGLGAWCIDKELQTKITINVYLELLEKRKFKFIDEVYFGWFNICGLDIVIPKDIKGIKISEGYRNPAEKLIGDNLILVCNWAWDPCSYIGNEYWIKHLGSSGDPAAACCSYIAFLGNHDIYEPKRVISY